jgi:hypothetical protein
MATEELFREDAYLASCEARVVAVREGGAVVLDRTVLYPGGGGSERGASSPSRVRRLTDSAAILGWVGEASATCGLRRGRQRPCGARARGRG